MSTLVRYDSFAEVTTKKQNNEFVETQTIKSQTFLSDLSGKTIGGFITWERKNVLCHIIHSYLNFRY